jgi:hypothetical protein
MMSKVEYQITGRRWYIHNVYDERAYIAGAHL